VTPDLLAVATSPLGGKQIFTYTKSALENNPGLHLNMPVVKTLTMDAGVDPEVAPPTVTTFSYSGGLYDGTDREFRGFRMVKATRMVDGRVTETLFHQDLERAGLVESSVTRDALGNAVVETRAFYTDDDAPGAPFVRLPATMFSTELAAAGSSAAPRITAMEMRYERDAAGLIQFGRVSAMIGEMSRSVLNLSRKRWLRVSEATLLPSAGPPLSRV